MEENAPKILQIDWWFQNPRYFKEKTNYDTGTVCQGFEGLGMTHKEFII
jgi:hypothetical protein